jgi:hypothetical protein
VHGDAREDPGAFALGLEKGNGDEDTEFEKRACGHLDVWCAPIDSDILDSSNACGDALLALEAGSVGWGGVYTIMSNSSIAAAASPQDSAFNVEDHKDQQTLSQKDDAARRTQEWSTMFERGWIMAAGRGCVLPVRADDAVSMGKSSKATAGTGRDKQICSDRAANELGTCMQKEAASTNTNSIPAVTACENDSVTREGETLLQALSAASNLGVQGHTGLWAAPQDDTDEERILEEQQAEWERSIFAFSDSVNLPSVASIDTVATVSAVNNTPTDNNKTSVKIPAPCFSPAPSTHTVTFAATPSRGGGGGTVKSLIQKMKNSPGGIMRKASQNQVSPVASTRQGVLAESSPAARISDLVKKAEENFEKEYGPGTWGGPARPLPKGRDSHDASSDQDDDDDLLV